jgi:hypothetical protein
MTTGATRWAWENSRASNGSLIVLLAITDECGEGEFTEMSVAQLMAKCRLSDKGVRRSVEALEALGELSVEPRPGGISRYVPTLTPVKMTGPTPVKMTGPPVDPGQNDRTPTPVKMTGPPEEPQVNGTPVKMTGPEIPDALDLGSVVSGERSSSKEVSDAPRPDVERICQHLADRIVGNGSKRPVIGKRWKDSARLLIDKDGLTEQQIHDAIDWCQQHHFWHRQILSMDKLRHQMDRLRLDWKAEREKAAGRKPPGGRSTPDDDYAAALERIRSRKENANGHRGNGDNRPAGQVSLPPAAD